MGEILRRIDRTGERFGRLVVSEMLYGYKNHRTYAKCSCDCGLDTIVCVNNLIKGATQSCGCLERESRFSRENHEKNLLGDRFGHLVVIEKTNRRATNGSVIWKCLCDCGNTPNVTSSHLLRGKTRSCGCNRISKYEEIVKEFLDENAEEYLMEYEFADCRNVFPLRFDFYLPKRNVCIECQGQQHYQPVDFFGGDTRYQSVLNNDTIKKNYCKERHVGLICLPYTLSEQGIKNHLNTILFPCND